MKLTVEFPSVSYREGPKGVMRLAQAIEQIGYDHIDMFDHVVMGYPMAGREPGPYPAQMPILEAFMALSYMAAVTSRVTLGTEVLVLPQRHPTLVAKQVSTLDTPRAAACAWAWVSAGRNRNTRRSARASARAAPAWTRRSGCCEPTGATPRWTSRGSTIRSRRSAWSRSRRRAGACRSGSAAARARAAAGGELGDGWLGNQLADAAAARHRHRRDPPPRRGGRPRSEIDRAAGHGRVAAADAAGKRFYVEHDRVVARVVELKAMGFEWVALNATAIFQAGARAPSTPSSTCWARSTRRSAARSAEAIRSRRRGLAALASADSPAASR